MVELTFDYLNKLADQTIFISALLGGFSIAIIANLLVAETNTRLSRSIMKSATLSACFFLISIFGMTKLVMMTTADYPIPVNEKDLFLSQNIGTISFFLGIIALLTVVAMAGWAKSKSTGIFTTIVALFALVFILLMTT